jgi:phenylacetate-CoA ligase
MNLKYVHLVGETYSSYVSEYIKNELGIRFIIDSLGAADTGIMACGTDKKGLTLWEEGIYFEIIKNELVITTLVEEAMPLIRYRIGDIVDLIKEEDGVRIIRLRGKDTEKIETKDGVIFPIDIEDAIFPLLGEQVIYTITLNKEGINLDIETKKDIKKEIISCLKDKWGITANVRIMDQIPRSPGKFYRLKKE